jgi:hypothetical protein
MPQILNLEHFNQVVPRISQFKDLGGGVSPFLTLTGFYKHKTAPISQKSKSWALGIGQHIAQKLRQQSLLRK